ncbi:hypothetical protein L0222_00530 [bacterium]|nr:hypothetical protein [bacterium]
MTGKLVEGGIREQTRQVILNIETILKAAESDLSHVVKVTVFMHDWKYFKEMNENCTSIHKNQFLTTRNLPVNVCSQNFHQRFNGKSDS